MTEERITELVTAIKNLPDAGWFLAKNIRARRFEMQELEALGVVVSSKVPRSGSIHYKLSNDGATMTPPSLCSDD